MVRLQRGSAPVHWVVGALLIVAVGAADHVTGTELIFSIFYLVPVLYLSWFVGYGSGVVASLLCAVLWFGVERLGGVTYSAPIFAYWNSAMRGLIWVMVAVLAARLHDLLVLERDLREAALEASRAKTTFLANTSHEIRTPLNAVLGTVSLLSQEPLSPVQRRHVQIIEQEGAHLLGIINDILDIAKIEAGRLDLPRRSADLAGLVDEVVTLLDVRARQKGLQLVRRLMPDLPAVVVTDPDSVRRILLNLVGNAIKFTERGIVSVLVERGRAHGEPRLRISVTDTGIGIPPDKLQVIFERFAQSDSSITRRYGGTGLGLSIAQRLTEALGGTISVESQPGRGTQFTVELPLLPGDPEEVEAEPPRRVPATPDTRRLRILLADDHEPGRYVVRGLLARLPYEIEEAEDGRVAVERVKTGSFDLVLMDVQMPGMDGHEATRAIRAWERDHGLPPVPILALTANAYPDDVQRSLAAGCNGHVTKPLRVDRLLEAIQEVTVDSPAEAPAPEDEPEEAYPLADLVPLFLADLEGAVETMERALVEGELDRVARIAHQLKGSGGTYGFPEISRAGAAIEAAARAGQVGDARRQVTALASHLASLRAEDGAAR